MFVSDPVIRKNGETIAFFSEAFRLIDTRLNQVIQEKKAQEGGQEWSGLFVSDNEVHHLLNHEPGNEGNGPEAEASWYARKLPSCPRFERMVQVCGLDELDQWMLIATVAPLLDAKYTRIYGYLHDNMGRTSASLSLFYLLFAESLNDRLGILERLSESAPLLRSGLLRSVGADHGQEAVCVNQAVFDFLIGVEPTELLGFPVRYAQSANVAGTDDDKDVVLCLCGGTRGEQNLLLEQQAAKQGWNCVEVDALDLKVSAVADKLASLETLFLCAALYRFTVCMSRFDVLLNDVAWAPAIQRVISRASLSLQWVLTGRELMDSHSQLGVCFPNKRLVEQRAQMPTFEARKERWLELLPDHLHESADLLAGRFEISIDEIDQTMRAASECADQRTVGLDDVFLGVRHRRGVPPSLRIQHMQTVYDWPDLILTEKCHQHLRQIEAHMLYLDKVRREWGFARRVPKQGLSVMFCGDSGVGKTMSAAIIAKSLKIDMYRVDISQVVSKYIGETEKNLAEVFDAAEFTGAALFFDEADALFSKRTDVGDSHDRYANLETSYLLQKMEEFGGLTILATNMRQNIDTAFLRRIHSIVEFPFPAVAERRKMWKSMFPAATPLGDDVDFDWLARNVVLSGGHLHHVVLEAAIQAAAENQPVCMRHVEHAVSREYEKLQKTCATIDWPSKAFNAQQNHHFEDTSGTKPLVMTGGGR